MPSAPQSRAVTIPFAVCCVGVALFSVMDATMKGLTLDIGLFNALFWRALTGSLLGLALMLLTRQRWPGRAALRLHLLRGSVVALMASLFFWALMRMPLAEAIALSFIAPLIALYLAALLLGERIGQSAIAASLLGLIGVGLILSGRLQGSYDSDAIWGAAAVLLSAALFAWNLIIQRQQAQLATPVEVAFFQHLVMFGVFALVAAVGWLVPTPLLGLTGRAGTGLLLIAHSLEPPAPDAWLLILAAACLAFTSLAALSWAYARAQAQHLIPVEYSAFIWAAIIGWLVFGEPLTLSTVVGAALIVAGCLAAARTGRPIEMHEGIA